MAAYMVKEYRTSISKACRIVNLPKSMYYYRPIRDDSPVISKLQELALKYPREGQDLYYKRIRQEGVYIGDCGPSVSLEGGPAVSVIPGQQL